MTLNPYEPPCANTRNDAIVVEQSRGSLVLLIQSFLASEITAFKFDEQIDQYRDSNDPIIRHVAFAVWYYYDDCADHLVCFSKQQWDYFQRLLLVLVSDCRIETKSERRWSVKQLIAAISLCVFAYFAFQSGWGQHLFILSIPFGFISIALSHWQSNDNPAHDPNAPIIYPFATFSDLATAYRSTGFQKTRYPQHIGDRTIRSPFREAFSQLRAYILWLILSPFPLLFQVLPDTTTETRIMAA